MLQPRSFIASFSAPRRIFEQSEQGLSSRRTSKTISRMSVFTMVYGTSLAAHHAATGEKSMPGKPMSMVMASSSKREG